MPRLRDHCWQQFCVRADAGHSIHQSISHYCDSFVAMPQCPMTHLRGQQFGVRAEAEKLRRGRHRGVAARRRGQDLRRGAGPQGEGRR